ncbi:hypothetical protein BKA81DRAFT_362548 [Phyllosticta paracitricarpa]
MSGFRDLTALAAVYMLTSLPTVCLVAVCPVCSWVFLSWPDQNGMPRFDVVVFFCSGCGCCCWLVSWLVHGVVGCMLVV